MGKKGWEGGGHSASLSTPGHTLPRPFLGSGKKRRRSRGREYGGRFHIHKKREKREVVWVARKEAREVYSLGWEVRRIAAMSHPLPPD